MTRAVEQLLRQNPSASSRPPEFLANKVNSLMDHFGECFGLDTAIMLDIVQRPQVWNPGVGLHFQ